MKKNIEKQNEKKKNINYNHVGMKSDIPAIVYKEIAEGCKKGYLDEIEGTHFALLENPNMVAKKSISFI